MSRPASRVTLLGLVALVTYGTAYYSYGVLIEPIRHATGWSLAWLGAVFSAVLLIGGIGCIPGGWLADRIGTRRVFSLAAVLGAGPMLASSYGRSLLVFGALYATGTGVVGALAFYHVTQSAAVRVAKGSAVSSLVRLTLFGALASTIFLPLTAWLTHAAGWRETVRIEAVLTLLVLVVAATFVSVRDESLCCWSAGNGGQAAIVRACRTAGFRRWVLASLVAGAAVDVVIVFQVTIMVRAGLSLGLAATIGGLRGVAQFGGRVGLRPVLRRWGTRSTVIASFLLAAVGALCLLAVGNLVAALGFCVLAGAAFGVISTLQGVYTHELIGEADLGLLLGTQQAVFALGSAIGPIAGGALISATGSAASVVLVAALSFVVAAAAMTLPRHAARDPQLAGQMTAT